MNIDEAIEFLDKQITNPSLGLPEEVFLFISRTIPIVNVDLLIKDENGRTLLSWRNDQHAGTGWHIPGGVVRYKETISDRIHAVAASELGAKIKFEKGPMAINEIIYSLKKDRGHFISLLYECKLISSLDKNLEFKKEVPRIGQWAWHNKCPDNIISVHKMYRKFIN